MGTKVSSSIDLSGPFFQRDPAKTFRANGRALMAAVAEVGRREVIAQMAGGSGRRARIRELGEDRVADHVVARTGSLSGRPWAVTAVVSVNNSGFSPKQGISLMAAASRVERQTHAFRRATTGVRRSRAVNLDELMKGIADG
jgi:hypothetical protein